MHARTKSLRGRRPTHRPRLPQARVDFFADFISGDAATYFCGHAPRYTRALDKSKCATFSRDIGRCRSDAKILMAPLRNEIRFQKFKSLRSELGWETARVARKRGRNEGGKAWRLSE
jgi:hypothetical protein